MAAETGHGPQESWVFKTPQPQDQRPETLDPWVTCLVGNAQLTQTSLERAVVYMLDHSHACCMHSPRDGGWSLLVLNTVKARGYMADPWVCVSACCYGTEFPSSSGSRSRDVLLASCGGGCLCNAGMAHRPGTGPCRHLLSWEKCLQGMA